MSRTVSKEHLDHQIENAKELLKALRTDHIMSSALNMQVDGNHYKKYKIQPMEYIHANNIPFAEGNAIKYITRWRDKNGLEDIDKAIHVLQMLKELELKNPK